MDDCIYSNSFVHTRDELEYLERKLIIIKNNLGKKHLVKH